MNEKVLEVISAEAMEQYEQVRQSGVCNMFHYTCVVTVAGQKGFFDLEALSLKDYVLIIRNHSALMKHYGVEQG